MTLLFLFISQQIFASQLIDGIYYELSDEAKTASVLGMVMTAKTTVSIPETVTYNDVVYTVTTIEDTAFYGLSLKSISLPSSISKIGDFAFAYSSIEEFTYPKDEVNFTRTQIIGDNCFEGCTQLTTVTLCQTYNKIGYYAFYGCTALKSFICMNATPPTATSNTFEDNTYETATLYVPDGWSYSYEHQEPWCNFKKIKGFSKTEIEKVEKNTTINEYAYDIQGRKSLEKNKGLNIVKMYDGTTKKIMTR